MKLAGAAVIVLVGLAVWWKLAVRRDERLIASLRLTVD